MNRRCAETARKAAEQRATRYRDPCFELLPPIDDFIRDVEAHGKSLGKRIRVPAEALDWSVASLDAVDKALKRIPWAKRPVPEILTPLVAYVGEVMRRGSGGRWSKLPTTKKCQVRVYDIDELMLWILVEGNGLEGSLVGHMLTETRSGSSATPLIEAARKAMEAVQQQEGGGSREAMVEAGRKAAGVIHVPKPEPFRFETVEEPIRGHENEPVIEARNGQMLRPFALLFIPMIEPSKRRPLRVTVEGELMTNGSPTAKQKAAAAGGGSA